MSNLGLKSSVVIYHGETYLGELDTIPISSSTTTATTTTSDERFAFPTNELRIHHLSPVSERCHPLSILHTISPHSLRCKLEPLAAASPSDQQNLLTLHASCFYELKTAVVVFDTNEIHLVAMPSKQKKFPCFWCYSIPTGLYAPCVALLNLRCLSIVFDLDETLIVANTMKSFEDRIEALKGWIAREGDPVRASGMSAELKRYVDDRTLLKQFTESDTVVAEGGKIFKVQFEEVSPIADNHDKIVRPVIRLPDKNLVLTRINPENRDTSVLVRLRPAWEDLRSYLTAKGRKRFEVFVCTMAERDYALEMWRLLDPGAHLINTNQLLNRVVCVKSGSRKSLLNVFQDGICHPNMAMVIDDRMKVWEDNDQPRVHVVPAFTPYYAPQAETASAVPVLCVARNVACNVRGGFFKDFDENLLRKISELFYEDDMSNVPSPPDVSNYLISEETGFVSNGNMYLPFSEAISGAEVEQRLPHLYIAVDSDKLGTNMLESGSESSQPVNLSVSNAPDSLRMNIPSQKGLLGVPTVKDVTNPYRDPPILKLPAQTSQGGWLGEDEDSRGQNKGYSPHESAVSKSNKSRAYSSFRGHSTAPSAPSVLPSRGRSEESSLGRQDLRKDNLPSNELTGTGTGEAPISQHPALLISKEPYSDAVKVNSLPSSLSISVLQEIGRRCCCKVEFKPILSTSKDLQFSVEVLFTGEKIGIGMGKTRKDAQQQAADYALRCLADKYLAYAAHSGLMTQDEKAQSHNENGFIWDDLNPQSDEMSSNEKLQREAGLEAAETAPGSTSSNVPSQHNRKVATSPRLQQSSFTKRSKDEIVRDTQSSTSARPYWNDHPLP